MLWAKKEGTGKGRRTSGIKEAKRTQKQIIEKNIQPQGNLHTTSYD
jgi:hypothetical protein